MKPFSCFLLAFFTIANFFSYGQSGYTINKSSHFINRKGLKELNQLATAARSPEFDAFVIYNNGDTVKGKALKINSSLGNGKNTWLIDGQNVSIDSVKTYQDDHAYYGAGGNYTRIYHGKINLYADLRDSSATTTYVSPSAKRIMTTETNGAFTLFYIEKEGKFFFTTYNNVRVCVQDNTAGLAQFDKEFPPKKAKKMFLDYQAFIRILRAYDGVQ
jgi:hypothetical protein